MSEVGLPARICYALLAIPVGGAAGFYSSILLLPKLVQQFPRIAPGIDPRGFFMAALVLGAVVAFTAFLFALTLPGRRRRKRRGRAGRTIVSAIFVLLLSLIFAAQGHSLVYDLALPVWLAYTVTFTFIRYGVIDQEKRRRASDQDPSSGPSAA